MLAHEIGHVLGLYHTYRGYNLSTYNTTDDPCKEYANGSNCLYCGDKICDTPSDPNAAQFTQVINGVCTYDEPNTDASNDIYSPDMENIMASLPLPCSIHFTEGQGARMRHYLSTNFYLKKLLVDEVELVNQQSIIVQLEQNWYADKSIKTTGTTKIQPLIPGTANGNQGIVTFMAGEFIELTRGLRWQMQGLFLRPR